jgi:hypothetical protein
MAETATQGSAGRGTISSLLLMPALPSIHLWVSRNVNTVMVSTSKIKMPPSCPPLNHHIKNVIMKLSSLICLFPETINHICTICSKSNEPIYLLNLTYQIRIFLSCLEQEYLPVIQKVLNFLDKQLDVFPQNFLNLTYTMMTSKERNRMVVVLDFCYYYKNTWDD